MSWASVLLAVQRMRRETTGGNSHPGKFEEKSLLDRDEGFVLKPSSVPTAVVSIWP